MIGSMKKKKKKIYYYYYLYQRYNPNLNRYPNSSSIPEVLSQFREQNIAIKLIAIPFFNSQFRSLPPMLPRYKCCGSTKNIGKSLIFVLILVKSTNKSSKYSIYNKIKKHDVGEKLSLSVHSSAIFVLPMQCACLGMALIISWSHPYPHDSLKTPFDMPPILLAVKALSCWHLQIGGGT